MRGGKFPRGYTILEVLIVLAITGVMFLIAATYINGKQQSTAFTQGVNEMASRIQAIIEGVTDGRYSDQPINCSISGSGSSLNITTVSPNSQGQNDSCIFLGKFIHIDGQNSSSYEVFTLADARVDATGAPITNINNSFVTPATSLTVSDTVPQMLQADTGVVKVTTSSGTYNTFGVGFTQGLGYTSAGSTSSGYQTISMVYGPNTTAAGSATELTGASALAIANSANICLYDGGNRHATITIGANKDNNLSVSVQYGTSSNC